MFHDVLHMTSSVVVSWYLSVFTCEDLYVFQSDTYCFQQPLDEIFNE